MLLHRCKGDELVLSTSDGFANADHRHVDPDLVHLDNTARPIRHPSKSTFSYYSRRPVDSQRVGRSGPRQRGSLSFVPGGNAQSWCRFDSKPAESSCYGDIDTNFPCNCLRVRLSLHQHEAPLDLFGQLQDKQLDIDIAVSKLAHPPPRCISVFRLSIARPILAVLAFSTFLTRRSPWELVFFSYGPSRWKCLFRVHRNGPFDIPRSRASQKG
jgi:hypothetical protein